MTPPPWRVDRIAAEDVADLCLGSVFLATGGGGDPYVNRLLTEAALREHGPVRLVGVESLADDDCIVPVGEVGAPTVSLEHLPNGDEPGAVLAAWRRATGRTPTHVIPFEVGGANSVVPLVAAVEQGLPVVDGDGMGRALPEAQMMTFAIEGVAPTPAVCLDYLGNEVILHTRDADYYERQVRQLAIAMGGMVFTAEHAMTGVEARRAVVRDSLSFAVAIGRLLHAHRGTATALLPELAELFAASHYGVVRHLVSGKVTGLSTRIVGGFDVGEATLEAHGGGAPITVAIRNEYLLVRRGEIVLAAVPDLITVVDEESSRPINAERLRYGQRVAVIAIGCPPHYRTDRALAVVAPRCFGFDVDPVLLDAPGEPGPGAD